MTIDELVANSEEYTRLCEAHIEERKLARKENLALFHNLEGGPLGNTQSDGDRHWVYGGAPEISER